MTADDHSSRGSTQPRSTTPTGVAIGSETVAQNAQRVVLVMGEVAGQLLDRVQPVVVGDEDDRVAVHTGGEFHYPGAVPFRDGFAPGQVEEIRVAGPYREGGNGQCVLR